MLKPLQSRVSVVKPSRLTAVAVACYSGFDFLPKRVSTASGLNPAPSRYLRIGCARIGVGLFAARLTRGSMFDHSNLTTRSRIPFRWKNWLSAIQHGVGEQVGGATMAANVGTTCPIVTQRISHGLNVTYLCVWIIAGALNILFEPTADVFLHLAAQFAAVWFSRVGQSANSCPRPAVG